PTFSLTCGKSAQLLDVPLDGGAWTSLLRDEQFAPLSLMMIDSAPAIDTGGAYFFALVARTFGDGGLPEPSDAGGVQIFGCFPLADLLLYAPFDGGAASVLASLHPLNGAPTTPVMDDDNVYFYGASDAGPSIFSVPRRAGVPLVQLRTPPEAQRVGPVG